MFDKFVIRKPKPRQPAAMPLKPAGKPAPEAPAAKGQAKRDVTAADKEPKELGGPSGPEPTRYGDWERKGICVDF